jgi:hypothetical protein
MVQHELYSLYDPHPVIPPPGVRDVLLRWFLVV